MEIERTGEDTITLTVSLEELGWLRMGLSTALEELGDDTHTIMGTTRDEIGRLLDESRDIYREVRPDLPWDEFDKMLEKDRRRRAAFLSGSCLSRGVWVGLRL